LLELLDEGVRVISLVADEGVRLDLVEKRRSLSDVGRLPGVSDSATGLPSASTTAWIFVVRPPRERPMA
jgi:hypothetical protein